MTTRRKPPLEGTPLRRRAESLLRKRKKKATDSPAQEQDPMRLVNELEMRNEELVRARAETQASEHARWLLAEALRETTQALNSTLDPETVLDNILEYAGRVVSHDVGDILLLDEKDVVRIARFKGYAERGVADWARGRKFPITETPVLVRVAKSRQAMVFSDTHATPGWVMVPETHWIRSYVCAPIVVNDAVVGFITLSSVTPGFYTGDESGRLQIFADQVGVALGNARLFETVKQSAEQLRALGVWLAESEANERRALAHELHDRVGQKLTTLSLSLNLVRRKLDSEQVPALAARLSAADALVSEITDHIRDVMAELHPPVLDQYGLAAALRWHAERLRQNTDLEIHVTDDESNLSLPSHIALALYRIALETLSNVLKHAHATRVTIQLNDFPNSVQLTITDNGVGFAVAEVPVRDAAHWGLPIIRERAAALGGSVVIESMAGKGTRVIVTMPR